MFTEPLAGWREVAVRSQRTKVDWAIEMARLLEGRYAHCERGVIKSESWCVTSSTPTPKGHS